MTRPAGMTQDEYEELRRLELLEWDDFLNTHCQRCGEPLACDGSCTFCEQQDHDELRFDA